MIRLRTYFSDLREGVRLLPEVLRLVFSAEYWAAVLQRYVDRHYTYRHFEEWAAWVEDMQVEGSEHE